MSTFQKSGSGSVVFTDGNQSYSFLSSYNVFPHPDKLDAIVITPEIIPTEYEEKGFSIQVSTVTEPAHTGRADLIKKLSEYFHKGGSGSGIFSLPEDHFFDTEAARDAALPNPTEGEMVAVRQADGRYLVQKYQAPSWVDQMLLARGPKGDAPSIGANGNWFIGTVDTGVKAAGDPIGLIDDDSAAADKTYSSNKVENLLVTPIKMFDDNSRIRYDSTTRYFHFETRVSSAAPWVDRAHIESSPVVDHIHFEETTQLGNYDVKADELLLISKMQDFIPEHYGSPNKVSQLRPFFVLPGGLEAALVAVFENQLRIPQDDGSSEYAAFKSELSQSTKMFGENTRIRLDPSTQEMYFETKDQDGNWVVKAEIGNSIIVDNMKFTHTADKPQVASDEIGIYSKMVNVPKSPTDQTMEQQRRLFFVLPDGTEVPLAGTWQNELRIPQNDGSNEYAAFKSEITGAKIISAINAELGNTNWQDGGERPKPSHPTAQVYYGFYHGDTIDSTGVANLSHKQIVSPLDTFSGHQTNPPNYFYIVMHADEASGIGSVVQLPSSLGSHWPTQSLVMNGESYTALRSPNRMYDASVNFKTLR